MSLDEILSSIFPAGHGVMVQDGIALGSGRLKTGEELTVIGVSERTPVGVEQAISLSRHVLHSMADADGPFLVIIDSDSQRMSRRDELLGLNEFLAHLAKSLILADIGGRPTIGLLYGHTAAGAFLATAMATRVLVALPSADPVVMDLPSMSRVTKLSIEVLEEKARSTPVFAPGLHNLERMGAVHVVWDERTPLCEQLSQLLADIPSRSDRRDELGNERGGRMKAAEIARRVNELARAEPR